MATGVERESRLRAALAAAGRPADAAALAVVPALLLAAFALPEATRVGLVLDYESPTIASMYASHFVHFSVAHLATNLAVYALAAVPAYCYCVLAGRRNDFFAAFVVVLTAFPFALSALNVALVRPRVGYGFSGLAIAFVGFLPVALALYAGERVAPAVTLDHAPLLFFVGVGVTTALVATAGSPSALTLTALTASAAGVALYGASLWRALGASGFRRAAASVGDAEFAAVGVVLVVLFPFVAFPQDIAVRGGVLNVYAHLLGYCLGFIVPFAALRVAPSTTGGARPRQ
ncbi:hypothetical protein [Halobacterium zhouii]|uniref:hypothetical protein n=1 Tax=Halobacterium zhouii TaxID=2902624 RepID=UPI001E63C9FE|nr:hypothetical protein [Halobacterium zhouii]